MATQERSTPAARTAASRSRAQRIALIVSWSAVLVAIVTVSDRDGGTLLDPDSGEHRALLTAYVLSSLFLVPRLGLGVLVYPHLVLVLALLVAHPITAAFGRDGTFMVSALHFGFVLAWCVPWIPQRKIVPIALLVGLALGETLLSLGGSSEAMRELPDYGDLTRPYGDGGFLAPNLRTEVVGPYSPVEFVTDSHGFRNREEVTSSKPAGRRRILLLGDSFIVGYRTAQERMVGRVLERYLQLRDETLEVAVAGAGHPAAALEWLEEHGFGFAPDLVVLGVTLGNDISQSWLARRDFPADRLEELLLPPDAYVSGVGLFVSKLDRTLRRWRLYKRMRSAFTTETIFSWYFDIPRRVHVFDPSHSLGHFYVRQPIAEVEESFGDLQAYLRELQAACAAKRVPLLVALLPQRFQTSDAEWTATGFAYGLDLDAFDRERPNRSILRGCREDAVTCVDLLPDFYSDRPRTLYQPEGDMHWNDAGHELAGRLLAGHVQQLFPGLWPTGGSR